MLEHGCIGEKSESLLQFEAIHNNVKLLVLIDDSFDFEIF